MDSWEDVDRTVVFSFEGHSTEMALLGRKVTAQFLAIDQDRAFPSNLRQPAANEFNTFKLLKSPNTSGCSAGAP